jgi:NTP pyrophosphatase (non-canonical NTP hydrolase)
MNLKDITDFVTKEEARISAKFFAGKSRNERLLAAAVKMSEEAGELNSEVLAVCGLQRAEKMPRYSNETLSEELADVLITALLVAEVAGVDVEKALQAKMTKISARDYGLPASILETS